MYICEDCYYGERPPMEMCNLCTMDKDGRMSCWTPKCKTPIGAVLQEAGSTSQSDTLSVSPAGRHLSQRERQGGDGAAGDDYLQCRIDDLQEQMGKLEAENEYLRKTLDWNKREQEILSGKLEMVYLIFGGGGDG